MTKDCHSLKPVLDIWWIHHFMMSKHIKRSLEVLKLTFNELTTKRFENNRKSLTKYTRFQQAGGQILRISNAFKLEVEQLIMSWFGAKYLREITLLRKLSSGMDAMDDGNQKHNRNIKNMQRHKVL